MKFQRSAKVLARLRKTNIYLDIRDEFPYIAALDRLALEWVRTELSIRPVHMTVTLKPWRAGGDTRLGYIKPLKLQNECEVTLALSSNAIAYAVTAPHYAERLRGCKTAEQIACIILYHEFARISIRFLHRYLFDDSAPRVPNEEELSLKAELAYKEKLLSGKIRPFIRLCTR